MKILSWNVNGLRAVHRKEAFLPWVKEHDADIICLNETKSHKVQLPKALTEIEGYHSYFGEADRKGYSGVAIYTKKKPITIRCGFSDDTCDPEGRILLAEYDKFYLYCIYFPNGKASAERLQFKMDFYHAFLDHAESMRASGKGIIVCGDVNTAHKEIDLARPKANENTSGFLPKERKWIDSLISYGYIDTFRKFNKDPDHYTWWDMKSRARDRNVGWRIDYFFISSELKNRLRDAFIQRDVLGSDHCPIGIEINL